MKTSNKILLGTLLTVMLILTGTHVAMYAKYKSGDFTVSTETSSIDTIDIKAVKFVRLTGMENVLIEPSARFSIVKPKVMPSYFKYVVSGDTLVITGDTSTYMDGNERQYNRMVEQITLRMPSVEKVIADHTAIQLSGSLDSASAMNTRFVLSGSALDLQQHFTDQYRYFGSLEVNASGNSRVGLNDYPMTVESLSCTLFNSSIEDAPKPLIRRLSVNPDDRSAIRLNGTNLKKLQMTDGSKSSNSNQ